MRTRIVSILLFVTALAPIQVLACTSLQPPPTDEMNFEKASSVFVAHVNSTEELHGETTGSSAPPSMIRATFRVIEILKGSVPSEYTVQAAFPAYGNCNLFLLAGFNYLFFADNNSVVDAATGSRPFSPFEAKMEILLSKLRKIAAGENHKP